ncbi:uncharacterized protein BDW43DRAFT_263735 [Aspergillus alliaceus]|uniref:uncharacterized protein n=1 Tax=Petromyces alliaceus TaxID=209559 RepID=UPI0012A763D3|nr:uncharacterized protein BDW43DRAFT_263735 [Aspergillus alliaceus]KAB8237591.1 hypothetical protein BDW43DRAFT_263735 [Aspergillus alliaceus]
MCAGSMFITSIVLRFLCAVVFDRSHFLHGESGLSPHLRLPRFLGLERKMIWLWDTHLENNLEKLPAGDRRCPYQHPALRFIHTIR